MLGHKITLLTFPARSLGIFSFMLALAGCSGKDGQAGQIGATGSDGKQGPSGMDGTPGTNGMNGIDGQAGSEEHAGGAGPAGADGASFDVQLSGAMQGQYEAPAPVNTTSSGTFAFSLDTSTGAITGSVHVSFDATKAHVHGPAFAGDTGPVVFELEQDARDSHLWKIPAGTVLSDDNLAGALAGALYVNAHSAIHTSGEVRGQILPKNIAILRSNLDSAHELPSPKAGTDDLASTGVGYLTLDTNSGAIHGNVRTSFVATKAHIHGPKVAGDAAGIAGRTSAVFQEMALTKDSTPEDDFWTLPADVPPLDATQLERVLAGDFYFNAHTASNPTGLVRGQIHGTDVNVYRVPLAGEQEVPAPAGGGGTGLGYLTVDLESGRVRGDVTATGFTPSKAHIHSASIGKTGPVVLEFAANMADPNRFSAPEVGFNGSLNGVFDAATLAALGRGQLYLNMHSAANPTGETRGQILPDNLELVRVAMDSLHEIPAPVGAAGSSALALFVVDPSSGGTQGFGRVSGFTATAFHIHAGAAGATGPVVIEFGADAAEAGKFNLPDGIFFDPKALASSGFYVNSHSAANKTGEVRGQLVLP